ncbi:Nicotinamidase-related amidase [Dyella jiangningensis]|uniref:cysteine hydrolase family protein n=2 Tax=Gammaproteobacteria TaxID=1236 RepID=UPI0008867BF1|nr:isochorismatase family protein [Dyella sp. AtDHG13]PXV61766.1 nicotinamidase-related amidase [Dyella sp. AtDHG13]SDJ64598.1 Nicotinamidase-related amidase [Dyella jiangningensis]
MTHSTIRTMIGACAPKALAPARTALLVIDFQNEYFDGRLPIPDGRNALRHAQRLIAHADAAGMAVYHVRHVTPAGSPVFAEDSATSAFHEGAQPAAHHHVVNKSEVSVFAGTDIDRRLKQSGIDTLIVTGLMTHACVAGAARDAVPLGYGVMVIGDACATRDLDNADGGSVPHAMLHRAALASIEDTFGDVLTTDQLIGLPLTAAQA